MRSSSFYLDFLHFIKPLSLSFIHTISRKSSVVLSFTEITGNLWLKTNREIGA